MKQFAKVFALGELQFGTSANGDWERQTLVVETLANNPTKIAIDFFGKKRVKKLQGLRRGMLVEVTFIIDSREHDGRWYVQCDGIDVQGFVVPSEEPGQRSAVPADDAVQGNAWLQEDNGNRDEIFNI